MQLLLRGAYLHFFPDLRSYVERRLQYALGRSRAVVTRAVVSLKNRKPARRESDWRCAIRVKLRGQPALGVDAVRSMPSEAIDEAIGRLGAKVVRGAPRRLKTTAPRRGRPEPVAAPGVSGNRTLFRGFRSKAP
jgi:hypothetical protein